MQVTIERDIQAQHNNVGTIIIYTVHLQCLVSTCIPRGPPFATCRPSDIPNMHACNNLETCSQYNYGYWYSIIADAKKARK